MITAMSAIKNTLVANFFLNNSKIQPKVDIKTAIAKIAVYQVGKLFTISKP